MKLPFCWPNASPYRKMLLVVLYASLPVFLKLFYISACIIYTYLAKKELFKFDNTHLNELAQNTLFNRKEITNAKDINEKPVY